MTDKGDDWKITDDVKHESGRGDPFAAAVRATRMPMLVTNPRLPDNPIVFVNDAFLDLTAYGRDEVMGRNCRFLQGPDTDPAAVARVRDAVAARQDIQIDILNYRKDGRPFWNALYMSPVTSQAGELQYFFASQLDVTERYDTAALISGQKDLFELEIKRRTRELQDALDAKEVLIHEVDHRVKNNLQMIASLIVMQSRDIKDEKVRGSLHEMLGRVESLSTVHRRLYEADDITRFDVAEFTRDLVLDLVAANPSGKITAKLDLAKIDVPAEKAAPIALLVHEIVTNALQLGFAEGERGTVLASTRRLNGHFVIEISDTGAVKEDERRARQSPFSQKLASTLGRQLQASLVWKDLHPGRHVTIEIPVEKLGKGE